MIHNEATVDKMDGTSRARLAFTQGGAGLCDHKARSAVIQGDYSGLENDGGKYHECVGQCGGRESREKPYAGLEGKDVPRSPICQAC